MRITPTPRLLGGVALWTLAALLALPFPALGPALLGAAAVGIALVALDGVRLRREPAIEVERTLPPRLYVGRPAALEIEIRNPSARVRTLTLHEAVPEDLGPAQGVFPRVRVPAGGRVRLRLGLRPQRRGDRPLGSPLALASSPFGLLQRSHWGAETDVAAVYPDTTPLLRPEALRPRQALAELGVRPVRRRGEGMEFESLRDYVAGDDPRRVDWAASARRGRAVVRRYQHERNHTLVIALDASRLMAGRIGMRTKLDHAVEASLALASAALQAGDRVALAAFDRELRGFLAPRSDRRELGHVVDFVRPLEPRLVEADYPALVRGLTLRQRQRALVVVLTDFVEVDPTAFTGALGVLGRRHEVLLVAIRDPIYAELDPAAGIGPQADAMAHAYRRIVLDDLLHEREIALARLRRQGLHTLDLPPAEMTAPVLNRYLALRYGAER